MMNLYLISQQENCDYDTYDAAVVCAVDEEQARYINPGNSTRTWTTPEHVTVNLIGVADESVEQGVVLASFNAG